jgi:hypothetical protein
VQSALSPRLSVDRGFYVYSVIAAIIADVHTDVYAEVFTGFAGYIFGLLFSGCLGDAAWCSG